jgi:hypothetical protein
LSSQAPTASQSVTEGQEIPSGIVLTDPLEDGMVWVVQVLPFQLSARLSVMVFGFEEGPVRDGHAVASRDTRYRSQRSAVGDV